LKYKEFKVRDDEWPPRFTKLELVFSKGTCLAFSDPRRLGRIKLRASPSLEPPISDLGPDPVVGPFPLQPFHEALKKIQAPIKAVLLDQERVVCGVGNWVADEVLFHSAVYPGTPAGALSDAQVQALHSAIVNVCSVACEVGADSSRFPPEWLFHYRWGNGKGGDRLPDGRKIVFETCAGRTTAWVPEAQKGTAAAKVAKRGQKRKATDTQLEDKEARVKVPKRPAPSKKAKKTEKANRDEGDNVVFVKKQRNPPAKRIDYASKKAAVPSSRGPKPSKRKASVTATDPKHKASHKPAAAKSTKAKAKSSSRRK